MPHKTYRYALFVVLFIAATLGCSFFSQLGNRFSVARGTVAGVATDVQEGRDLLGTARAITTDVGGSGLIRTAQAMATSAGESGLLSTAETFATQQGPELKETVQAFATEQGPGLVATAQAMATQAAPLLGETPADIPLMSGQRENFVGTKQLVSYSTAAKFTDVIDFYKKEMVSNGWQLTNEQDVSGTNLVILTYQKPDRTASITIGSIPLTDKTTVLIAILPR
jgi:hypothetical protein